MGENRGPIPPEPDDPPAPPPTIRRRIAAACEGVGESLRRLDVTVDELSRAARSWKQHEGARTRALDMKGGVGREKRPQSQPRPRPDAQQRGRR